MTNTYQQTILFDLPLPPFLINFKNSIINTIVPYIDSIIRDLQTKQQNNSIVGLLCLLIIFMIFKEIVAAIFRPKPQLAKIVTQVDIDDEIRNLGKQIVSLKSSLKRIINQASKDKDKQKQTDKQRMKIEQNQGKMKQQSIVGDVISVDQANKLMKYFRESAEEYNSLAQYILQSQQLIFKELKNVKKLRGYTEKTSSHGSRDESGYEPIQTPKQIPNTTKSQQVQKNVPLPQKQKQPILVQQSKQQVPQIPVLPVRSEVKSEVVKAPPKGIAPPPPGRKRPAPPPPPAPK